MPFGALGEMGEWKNSKADRHLGLLDEDFKILTRSSENNELVSCSQRPAFEVTKSEVHESFEPEKCILH